MRERKNKNEKETNFADLLFREFAMIVASAYKLTRIHHLAAAAAALTAKEDEINALALCMHVFECYSPPIFPSIHIYLLLLFCFSSATSQSIRIFIFVDAHFESWHSTHPSVYVLLYLREINNNFSFYRYALVASRIWSVVVAVEIDDH